MGPWGHGLLNHYVLDKGVLKGLPKNVKLSISGTAGKLTKTWNELLVDLLLALVIVYLVMAVLFESFIYPLIILLAVPVAAAGGIAGLAFPHLKLLAIGGPVDHSITVQKDDRRVPVRARGLIVTHGRVPHGGGLNETVSAVSARLSPSELRRAFGKEEAALTSKARATNVRRSWRGEPWGDFFVLGRDLGCVYGSPT